MNNREIAGQYAPKRALVVGRWSTGGHAIQDRAGTAAAAESDWRAKADEGGCAEWGTSWAFTPTNQPRESMTEARAMIIFALAIFAVSLAIIALADAGLLKWPL